MILCLGTTPAVQRVMVFGGLERNRVNRAEWTLDGPSGKCVNVAKALRALGANASVVTVLGGPRGAMITDTLQALGITLLANPVASPTRQCVTVVDQSTGEVTELVEESSPVSAAEAEAFLATVDRALPTAEAVVMSGSLAPGMPTDLYRRYAQRARETGVLAIVDAQGPSLLSALEARPGLVKPNRAEAAATLRITLTDELSARLAARELCERGSERVVMTAGADPILATDGRRSWRIAPAPIQPLNPIGSGDAFTAAVCQALLRGDDLGEACRWGAAAGAANALSWMPGELAWGEVQRLYSAIAAERWLD